MSNVSGLVNNIVGTVKGLVPSDPTKLYPVDSSVESILSSIDPGNWLRLSSPYTFGVMDAQTNLDVTTFGAFPLPIAPQSIEQSEPPAIVIQRTQGGTSVSHSGMRYKKLSISGTTGNHPFKGTGGALTHNGQAILQPNELKYKSGYEVFLLMRNWFRAYYQYKSANPDTAKDWRLVFKNYKDGEFLVVELEDFSMKRQAGRPFLYDYDLKFDVIAHVGFKKPPGSVLGRFDFIMTQVIDALDFARGVFLRTQEILKSVEATYDQIVLEPLRRTTLAAKSLIGVGLTAKDVTTSAVINTAITVIDLENAFDVPPQQPVGESIVYGISEYMRSTVQRAVDESDQSIISQLQDATEAELIEFVDQILARANIDTLGEDISEQVRAEAVAAIRASTSTYQVALQDLKRVKANLEDSLNLSSPEYDTLFDRTLTQDDVPVTKEATIEELEVLFAFNRSISALETFIAAEKQFENDYNERLRDTIEQFGGELDLLPADQVRELTLPAGITIERLALQELGSIDRWIEIAELNNLEYPYFVQDFSSTLPNVKKVGDSILIPDIVSRAKPSVPQVGENDQTRDLDFLRRSFGSDLKLTDDNDIEVFAGDFQTTAGIDNLRQQIFLKLQYRKRDLERYPEIGAGLEIGGKVPSLQSIRDDVTRTLLQDPRINKVEQLVVERENSAVTISFVAKAQEVSIPLSFRVEE